jgi:hypothetical protein
MTEVSSLSASVTLAKHEIKLTECRGKWVPVNTTWRVLRLRLEERPPNWRVAAYVLNKQSQTADEG